MAGRTEKRAKLNVSEDMIGTGSRRWRYEERGARETREDFC